MTRRAPWTDRTVLLCASSLVAACIGTTPVSRAVKASEIHQVCDEREVETRAIQSGQRCLEEYYYWKVYCADDPNKVEQVVCAESDLFCHQPQGFCYE